MQDAEYGLPRIHLLGNSVNKGKKKGRGVDAPALYYKLSSFVTTLVTVGACLVNDCGSLSALVLMTVKNNRPLRMS